VLKENRDIRLRPRTNIHIVYAYHFPYQVVVLYIIARCINLIANQYKMWSDSLAQQKN